MSTPISVNGSNQYRCKHGESHQSSTEALFCGALKYHGQRLPPRPIAVLLDAEEHASNAAGALGRAAAKEGDSEGIRTQLLRIAEHELTSALEAVRHELGSGTVSLEATKG